MLLDVVCVFNNISSLSQREQAVKLTQDGFEVVSLQLTSFCFSGAIEEISFVPYIPFV